MSILIKGMEMPSEQYGKMVITLYPNGHVAEYVGDMGRVWEAAPVPPHGRLIDADAALRDGWTINRTYPASPTEMVYEVKAIDCLPTIIPAEEGER